VLYFLNTQTHTLSVYRSRYQPPTPSSFWSRWFLQFAVGQAF